MFEVASLLIRLVVGTFLLVAGFAKWRHGTRSFARAIRGYRLLPADLPDGVARLLPFAEMGIGAALIAGTAQPVAALFAAALLTLFATAMASALVRGFAPDCGCASARGQRVSWRLVYRNLALAALLVPVAGADATAVAGTFAMSLTATALLVGLHLFSRHGARGVTRVLRMGERT